MAQVFHVKLILVIFRSEVMAIVLAVLEVDLELSVLVSQIVQLFLQVLLCVSGLLELLFEVGNLVVFEWHLSSKITQLLNQGNLIIVHRFISIIFMRKIVLL